MKLVPISFLGLIFLVGDAARADSLWATLGGDHLSMFADRKASRVGDIVTVVVAEAAAASSTQNKQSSRTSTTNDTVGQLFFPPTVSGLGTHGGALPSLQLSGASNYTGGGQITNSQTVTSTAAVLVTDVLPNGNMVIEGVRLITFSGESQYIVLHGIIRPDDIASNDTISSTSIAQARVEVVNKGSLADSEKLGWLSKLYEQIHPF